MTFQTTYVSVCNIYSIPAANSALVSDSEFAPTLTSGRSLSSSLLFFNGSFKENKPVSRLVCIF